MPVRQMALWDSPEAHALGLHPPQQPGRVTLARRDNGRWREWSLPVADLAEAVRCLAGETDVFLTQNRFWIPRRRIAGLAYLDALFADLDFYKVPELAGRDAWQVREMALQALQDAEMPLPSVSVSHGHGLALIWLHEPVPRAALPRWNACQKRLFGVLRHLGADARARDAARVLRLIGSRHGQTGSRVEALTPTAAPLPFDDLADQILPLTRAELHDLRIHRALRNATKPAKATAHPPKGFTLATLWEARLTDLQRLLELRQWTPLPAGHRDVWLFLTTVAMSWLAESPDIMRREVYELARQVGGWSDPEARTRLQTAIDRAYAAARGETVQWAGQARDPRYYFHTETIVDWLQITPEEQVQMQTLIGPDEDRRRNRLAHQEARRKAGVPDRATYLARVKAEAAERAKAPKPWQLLGLSRATWYRMGKPGETNDVRQGCVPLYGGVAPAEGGQLSGEPLSEE